MIPRQDVTFVLRRRWVGVKLLAPFMMSAISFRHNSVHLIYFWSHDIPSPQDSRDCQSGYSLHPQS
jgi:hypothetical protein